MRSKKIFSRWTIGAFLIFLLSSSVSGLFTFQFGSVRSALSLNPMPTVQVSRPATSSRPTPVKPRSTPMPSRSTVSPVVSTDPRSFVIAEDTFNRPDQTRWGQTIHNIHWEGGANTSPAFFIQNGSGHVKGQGTYYATLQPSLANLEVIVTGSTSSFQDTTFGPIVRWVNDNTWYEADLDGTKLSLVKRSTGVVTTLASVAFAANVQTAYTIRCRVLGNTISAKAWMTGGQEPTDWLVTVNDSSFQSGFGGISFLVSNGSTITINQYVLLGLI